MLWVFAGVIFFYSCQRSRRLQSLKSPEGVIRPPQPKMPHLYSSFSFFYIKQHLKNVWTVKLCASDSFWSTLSFVMHIPGPDACRWWDTSVHNFGFQPISHQHHDNNSHLPWWMIQTHTQKDIVSITMLLGKQKKKTPWQIQQRDPKQHYQKRWGRADKGNGTGTNIRLDFTAWASSETKQDGKQM